VEGSKEQPIGPKGKADSPFSEESEGVAKGLESSPCRRLSGLLGLLTDKSCTSGRGSGSKPLRLGMTTGQSTL
jgi:hypothetical protein